MEGTSHGLVQRPVQALVQYFNQMHIIYLLKTVIF